MPQNLFESFRNMGEEPDSLVDYFIESIHIRLLGCGTQRTTAASVSNFLLPDFLVVYYRKGSVELRHGSQTTLLKPGSFYVFRPYDLYSGRKIGEDSICFSYLQFDITPFMERYHFGAMAMTAADTVFQDAKYQRLGKILEGLAEDAPQTSGRTAMLRQLVKFIMAQIIYDQSGQSGGPELLKRGRESKVINHAFQYVAEHLSEPIVIGNILKDGVTSKTNLERTFRNVLGTTPQRALMRFKIERSMELLQQNVSLKNIVKTLGFSSVYHFSNAFKAAMGIRPTEYRNRITKREKTRREHSN